MHQEILGFHRSISIPDNLRFLVVNFDAFRYIIANSQNKTMEKIKLKQIWSFTWKFSLNYINAENNLASKRKPEDNERGRTSSPSTSLNNRWL